MVTITGEVLEWIQPLISPAKTAPKAQHTKMTRRLTLTENNPFITLPFVVNTTSHKSG